MRGQYAMTVPLLLALVTCNAAIWNPFSFLKGPLRPPVIAPLVPPLRPPSTSPRLQWRQVGPLGCPYGQNISLPLCGSIFDLVAERDQAVYEGKDQVMGRLVVCDSNNVAVAALWNPMVEQESFPKFQDSREEDPSEWDRLCRVGFSFVEWLEALTGEGTQSTRLGGCDRLPGIPNPVVVCNGVQSNFVAPYDFVIASGAVVRQSYAKYDRPFDSEGTWCWVMQLSGKGQPRIVSVCVGEGDVIRGQAKETMIPQGFLSKRIEERGGEVERLHPCRHPLCPPGGAEEIAMMGTPTLEEGISGLPLLLSGRPVASVLQGKLPGRPLAPNEVLWDPATTKAAFTAIATKGKDLILASLTEEVTVCELAALLQKFGAEDALLLGGSGDVSMWVKGEELEGEENSCFGGSRIFGGARKGGSRKGLFPPGERPLNCVLIAYLK